MKTFEISKDRGSVWNKEVDKFEELAFDSCEEMKSRREGDIKHVLKVKVETFGVFSMISELGSNNESANTTKQPDDEQNDQNSSL